MESKALERYLHKLKRALPCSRPDRERLLSQGRRLLEDFLGENPEGGYEALTAAFGPPEVFAGEMLSTLDQEALNQARTRRVWLRRGGALLAAAVLILAVIFFVNRYQRAVQVIRAGGWTSITDEPVEVNESEFNELFGIDPQH